MNEVNRQEIKYFMTLSDAKKLCGKLDLVMMQDVHNGADGYTVRSLYFDSLYDRDYTEKLDGLELRRKIRLRIYDAKQDFAMLEMKQKEGNYQRKRSLRMSRNHAVDMIRGDYRSLLEYEDPFAAECYGMMQMHCYRPKTIVEYHRKAYIARENHIRVTIDHRIKATEANPDLFAKDLNLYPVFDPFHVILEVKYNGFMLSYIRNLINGANRSACSMSKYCMARSIGMNVTL